MSKEITADGLQTTGTQTQSPASGIWQGNDTERLLQENRDRNPVGSDPLKQPEVQKLVDMSPTLKSDIEKLKAENWNFEYIEGYSRVSEKDGKKFVYISNNGNEAGAVNSLSHETGHALRTVPFEYTKDKKAYMDSRLEDEGAATMKNLQVRDEILANSKGKIDIGVNCGEASCNTRYKEVWDKYLADGDANSARKEIAELKRPELMGDSVETYEQYYGRGWDEFQRKLREFNQQKLQGNSPAPQVSAPAASNQADTPSQPAPSNESQADIRVPSNINTEEWRRQADAFRQLPPEKAVEQHPELAPAYGSMRAVESKVEADGLTEQQRNVVMDRTRENIAGQIERGKIPDMQVREESQTQAVQQAEMSR